MSNETAGKLTVGQPAPGFTLPATGARTISLKDYQGKQAVVLYFYPKDDTPGCTKEACAFRDLESSFGEVGAAILGVSTDPVDSHEAFARKFSLGFPLLADLDASVATAYGAYGSKNFYGKESVGVLRTTFVIDREGILRKIYPNVKVDQHADEVLAFLGTL
ncbi:MAG: thioredoxin-dependent thiol peroxidase [Chloroflexota bacterium]